MNFDFLFDSIAVRRASVGVLILLCLFLLAETIGVAQNFGRPANPPSSLITVNADGKAVLPPDVARVTFTVQNTAPAVADAQAATTKQANAVIDFVKGQGIADKDVKTLSYNVTPQYSYRNPCQPGAICPDFSTGSKVTGYEVSESIQVTMRDLTKVGDLLGGLGKLSVQNINGPSFALDDPTAGYSAARADAIAKAKVQADQLAKQLGVSLGKIINFSENSGNTSYPMAYSMGGGDVAVKAAATPNLPAGDNTYTASVSITYEIR